VPRAGASLVAALEQDAAAPAITIAVKDLLIDFSFLFMPLQTPLQCHSTTLGGQLRSIVHDMALTVPVEVYFGWVAIGVTWRSGEWRDVRRRR